MDPWLSGALVVAALLLAWIAALSALETAVCNARRSRLPQRPQKRSEQAAAILESPDTFQASAHLAKALGEAFLYPVGVFIALDLALRQAPPGGGPTLRDIIHGDWPHMVLGGLLTYLAVTIVGETLPKSLAAQNPEQLLVRHLGFIRGFTVAFGPALWLVRAVARWLARSAGADPSAVFRAAHSEQEIKLLVEDSAVEGMLEEEEKEMIHSIFDFTDTVARQIMAPRIDIRSVSLAASVDDIAQLILETGHSRIPVYQETLDCIVGVVHAKDVLSCVIRGDRHTSITRLMREPFFVPEAKKIDELLEEFREHKSQMAIVVDEFGGTSGLVTIEDVLEEIVGEIHDEYDAIPEPESVAAATGSGTIVDARMTIEDVNEELHLELPDDEYDTIGGLVFGLFGHPPAIGERINAHGAEFVAEAMDGVRLLKIRVVAEALQPEPEPAVP